MSSRILYRSNTYDPETQLPLYILDSFFLPSSLLISEQIKSDEDLLNSLISRIDESFALIIFSSSFNKIESRVDKLNLPIKLIKLFKSIPSAKLQLLQKVYIVHHNWFTKSLLDIFNVVRYNIKITHCDSLTSLSRCLDITRLNISLPTYLYDLNLNEKIIIPIHLQPIFKQPIILSNEPTVKVFKRLHNKLIEYLKNGDFGDVNLLLGSPVPSETRAKVNILSDCIKRHQILNLSDWSFAEIYQVLIEFLTSLTEINQPLIPVLLIIENKTMEDLFNYEYHVSNTRYNNRYIISKLFKLFQMISAVFETEKSKLLYVLELSKNFFNLSFESDDHSKNFNDFFEFMKSNILDPSANLSHPEFYKIDEAEWDKAGPRTPPQRNRILTKLVDTSYPPTPPLPRKLASMTINDNNSLSSVSSSGEEGPEQLGKIDFTTELNEAEKENINANLKPRYERLVNLTKPTLAERKELEQITKEIKLKPWVTGKKVTKLTMLYEKQNALN